MSIFSNTLKILDLDGGYNSWGLWSECTKDCGGGIQYRTRWCVDPHPRGKGKECSEQKELGPAIKSRSCNEHDCSEGTIKLLNKLNTFPLKVHYFHEQTQAIYAL